LLFENELSNTFILLLTFPRVVMSLMMSPLKLLFHCNFVNSLRLHKSSGIVAFSFAPPPHTIAG
jgi:hypothetical protein